MSSFVGLSTRFVLHLGRVGARYIAPVLVISCADVDGSTSKPPPTDNAATTDRTVSAVDDVGRTVRLPHPARRIVSLVPSVTETLVALGADDRLVGRTDYDDAPGLRDLPSVGGGLDPSLETLVALRPDLVVTWATAGGSELRQRLERLGIPVFAVATEDTAGVYANIRRVGHLIGRDSVADSLNARIRAGLDAVRTSVAGLPRPTILYVVGMDPPRIAGPRTFIGQLIESAGGRMAFRDMSARWPQVSMEEIVRRQPERVLIAVWDEDGTAGVRRQMNGPGWSALRAVQCGRVAVVKADLLNRPGPRIVESARTLRDAIHTPNAECRP